MYINKGQSLLFYVFFTAGKPEVGLPRASHGTRDMEIKGELHPYFI